MAKKRHKQRLGGFVIQVRQQIQRLARSQPGHQGLGALAALNQLPLPKALPPRHDPAVHHRIDLRKINGVHAPRHLLGQGRPCGVQPHKVRRKNHHGSWLCQLIHRARQLQPLAHHIRWRVPEPTAVQPSLSKVNEGLPSQVAPLGMAQLRKTHLQIGHHHTPPGAHRHKQCGPQHPTQSAQQPQGHMRQAFHQRHA